jgi:hypothetical protein
MNHDVGIRAFHPADGALVIVVKPREQLPGELFHFWPNRERIGPEHKRRSATSHVKRAPNEASAEKPATREEKTS